MVEVSIEGDKAMFQKLVIGMRDPAATVAMLKR